METLSINFIGIFAWFLFCGIAVVASGWWLQHVWHFHPFLLWLIGCFGQAVIVAAFLDIIFRPGPAIVTGYFMGTMLAIWIIRIKNPIQPVTVEAVKSIGTLSVQDRDSCWLAVFHLIALSAAL